MFSNNFRESTIQDFINVLGYDYIQKSNKLYFDCVKCDKKAKDLKFNVFIKNGYIGCRCFVCGFKANLWELKKELGITNNSHQNINHKTKETAPATTKQTKTINISLDNLKLIESFPILNKDIKKFESKRGFKPNLLSKNFISLTDDLITAIEKTNLELSKKLKYYKDKKDYHLIILYKNEYQELETLRLYSFTNKEAKKITITGQKTRLYGLENITKDTKKIVFVEGEEKAEAGNIYRKDKNIVFLSISGIGIHAPALEFIEKYPALEYFVMFDNDNRDLEKKAAYSLACKLNDLKENQVRIIELPSIAEKVDLDSYLGTFKEHEKTPALTRILNDSYTISDYQEKNINSIEIEKFERKPPKFSWKAPAKEDLNRENKTLEEIRNELPSIIKNHKQGLLLLRLACGTGKTTAIIKASKEIDIHIGSPTIELRNEIANTGNFDVNISLNEHCKSVLDNNLDKVSIEESQKLFKSRQDISNLGYNAYKTYCKYECKLSNICQNSKEIAKTPTIVETHAKILLRKNDSFKKDLLVIDENFSLTDSIIINLVELDKMLWFYDDIHLKQILINIKNFFHSNISNLAGKNLYNEFKKSFNNPSLKNLLSALDIETIKTVTINKQYEKLPNKNSLKQLINAIENKFQSTTFNYFYDGFVNHSYLTIDFLKEFNPNIPILNTDATGNINILKKQFPNLNVSIYNPKIELTGINYKAFYHKTFSASNLFNKKLPLKDNEIVKVIEILSKNKKVLVTAPAIVKEKLEIVFASFDNISFETYASVRGSNKYQNYDLSITLPPKINYKDIIRKGKITGDSISTELYYKNVPTGFIKNNQELNISLWHFKDKYLNELLKQQREALMYQALFRIKRDTNIKEFITFGNISLKDYGLIPNEILEVKDIYKKEVPKTHQELRDLIKDFTKKILEKKQFILKSEITELYDFLKNENLESLVNIKTQQKSYNIYNILIEKNWNLTNIMVSAKAIEKKYFYEIVNTSLRELKNEYDFLEVNFPLIDKPNLKILLKNDSALEIAKEFYKDILFSKLPAPAPTENIISTSEVLEAGLDDKEEIENTIIYENIPSSVFDDSNLLKNSISEVRKNLYQGYSVEYLHKELDNNFLEFMKNKNFVLEFFRKDNLYFDCIEYDYTAFLSNKYFDSLDISTIEKYNVDFSKIFTTVTNFLTAKEQLESKNIYDYDSYVQINIVSLIASLEKYLNGLYLKSKILDDNYLIELDNYLYDSNLTINQTYRRIFIYLNIVDSFNIINSDIEENNKLKDIKYTSGIKKIILKVLFFFKLPELIAV